MPLQGYRYSPDQLEVLRKTHGENVAQGGCAFTILQEMDRMNKRSLREFSLETNLYNYDQQD